MFFIAVGGGVQLSAQMTVSGVFDSTLALRAGAGDSPAFSFGIEEYANIRFRTRLRERGSIDGAVNFIAAAGHYATDVKLMTEQPANVPAGFSLTPYVYGQNFIAGKEAAQAQCRR